MSFRARRSRQGQGGRFRVYGARWIYRVFGFVEFIGFLLGFHWVYRVYRVNGVCSVYMVYRVLGFVEFIWFIA